MSALRSFKFGGELTTEDYESLKARWITPELADAAQISRVGSLDGRGIVGRQRGDCAGLVIPNIFPGEISERSQRLRLDEPPVGSGQKYLAAPGQRNVAYFFPATPVELLSMVNMPVIITEGEFKVIALWRLATGELVMPAAIAELMGPLPVLPKFLPMGFSGCWNWKGTIGKTTNSKGVRVDVSGTVPDLDQITWTGRKVILAYDADAATNASVRAARYSLARELRGRGAQVAFLEWPEDKGKGIDDLLAIVGAQPVLDMIAALDFKDWRSNLITNKEGDPKAVFANAVMAFAKSPDWAGVLGFDEFALRPVALLPPPWPGSKAGPWTDQQVRQACAYLQHHSVLVDTRTAGEAALMVARENPFHPVRQYLESLTWDGVERLELMPSLYLGVEQTGYAAAVAKAWMISCVARAEEPGCQADAVLNLEGKQGIGKTTALRILGGEWHTSELGDLGTKDAAMQVHAAWIVELGELDALSKSEVSKTKEFLSRTKDQFRLPYGRDVETFPRSNVFAGSCNLETYFKDESGNRRFWPLRCTHAMCIESLKRDRDQLWAESVHRYKACEKWWLDKAMTEVAEQEQADRYQGGHWDDQIRAYVENLVSVDIDEILSLCIQKANWNEGDRRAVGRALTSMGWKRCRLRPKPGPTPGPETGTARPWRYFKPGYELRAR